MVLLSSFLDLGLRSGSGYFAPGGFLCDELVLERHRQDAVLPHLGGAIWYAICLSFYYQCVIIASLIIVCRTYLSLYVFITIYLVYLFSSWEPACLFPTCNTVSMGGAVYARSPLLRNDAARHQMIQPTGRTGTALLVWHVAWRELACDDTQRHSMNGAIWHWMTSTTLEPIGDVINDTWHMLVMRCGFWYMTYLISITSWNQYPTRSYPILQFSRQYHMIHAKWYTMTIVTINSNIFSAPA